VEWPGPPDFAGKVSYGSRSTVDLAVARGHPHFAEQFVGGPVQEGLHARVLQRGKTEAALLERGAEAVNERSAHRAITIKTDPPAGCMTSFCISHF
jgi:hypothetical protein